jgi:hypothetical protein
VAIALLAFGLPKGSQAGYTYSYDYLLNAWRCTPKSGFFFCKGDVLDFPAWYFQILEGKRSDLPVLGGGSLPMDWYRIRLAKTQPGLNVPYPTHEKGKEYISGHLMLWMVEHNPGHRPFFTFPDLRDDGMSDHALFPYGLVQEAFAPGAPADWQERTAEKLWEDMRLRHFSAGDRYVDEVTWGQFLKDYGAARSWMAIHYTLEARVKNPQAAAEDYRKSFPHMLWAQAWDPKNAAFDMNLGLVEMHFGDKAKAMEWFERALTTDPKNASFFYYAGKMAEILGEHEKAQAWTQEASRLDPKYPSAAIPKP